MKSVYRFGGMPIRARMGEEARKIIEHRYSLRFASFELFKIFQDLVKGDSHDVAN